MDLIVVESPTKARTLKNFLGKDFDFLATKGHIKDLPKSKLSIDIENNFAPDYTFVPKKKDVIKELKEKSKKAKKVFLATDPDREGEAISAHTAEVIGSKKKTLRIVFHEITKDAVENALKNPRDIDKNLVNAQISRRVLDRLVGYKLSPLLWRKVRRGLSAGRVQTVTVRLIVEREREIGKFVPVEYWEIFAEVKKENQESFSCKLVKLIDKSLEVKNEKDAKKVVSDLEKSSYRVSDVSEKEVRRSSYPPFTTSTMTQAASRIFNWSAKRTMSLAQNLYEEGLITYHRTDSYFVSNAAITKLRDYIKKSYGEKYLSSSVRFFKTKSKVAQEAHEAIRPTNVSSEIQDKAVKYGKDEEILYNLIRKRFLATQMAESIYNETIIDIEAKKDKENIYLLRTKGLTMIFDGWKKIFNGKAGNEEKLPKLAKGDLLQLLKVTSEQKFTQPPERYTEATLIKTLEKLGIGRPSTYAPIITTIQVRNYVEKDEGKFIPTNVGIAVNDFLTFNFPDVFDYEFTAKMEDELDGIANGEKEWTVSMKNFWDPFAKRLGEVSEKSKRVKIEVEETGIPCPKCKKGKMVVRIGRFGKFLSCSRFPDCDYKERYVEKIGMKCPECRDGDVIIQRTKRGRKFYGCSNYPKCKWASWRKPTSDTKSSS